MTKVLWTVGMRTAAQQARLLANAQTIGAGAVAIRSDNAGLAAAIPQFHAAGINVYAWRWPSVTPGPHAAPHYFAMDEAAFVTGTLMPAGLDGYIIDAESDGPGQANDWDSTTHQPLALQFCQAIDAAVAGGVPTCAGSFQFGVTAGCRQPINNPHIPWGVFAHFCDALYPQAYWRAVLSGGPTDIHGGTPASAAAQSIAAWAPLAAGKRVICMAGELGSVTAAEIAAYGVATAHQNEQHFYTDQDGLDPDVLAAIQAL